MATGATTLEPPRGVRRGAATLRQVLREHPAGPEVVAALGAVADRTAPAGWSQWAPEEQERYLDAVLDEVRAGGRRAP
jgi:hypothetical protein